MNPDDYCEAKAAPPGSDRHYALLGLGSRERAALNALWTLEREVLGTPVDCRDPGVARTKLDWWRTELGRLAAGAPEHPATRALAPHLPMRGLDPAPLGELIDAAGILLDYDAFPGFEALAGWCHRSGSTPLLFAAELLGLQDRAAAVFAHELGFGLALLARLREVRADALAGRFFVPEDEMREAGVTHPDLYAGSGSAHTRTLFVRQGERIRATFARARAGLPDGEHARLAPLLVRLALAEALLDEIERDGWRLLEHRVELTPLRKLWIAWNTLRRARV